MPPCPLLADQFPRFNIYYIPDHYLIDVTIVDLTRLVRGLCRERCHESVKADLRMYDFLIAPYI